MNRIILLLLLFVTPCIAFTQGYNVRAKVVDSTSKKEVPYATVAAYVKADSSYIAGTLTDSLGYFELVLKPQKYLFEISHLGFEKILVSVDINREQLILNDIELVAQVISLNDLVVKGGIESISHQDDKTVYRIVDMPAAKSGTIDDILKSLPSLTQDFNGTTLVNGVPARFFIDGRELLNSELEAYSPSQIESVEVISNPTSKYDADGLSGIIHFKSKKSSLSGVSSAVNLSGTHDTQSGSLSVVYNKDRFSLSANAVISNTYQHGSIETITGSSQWLNSVKADILNVLANVGGEYSFSEHSKLNMSYQYVDFGYTAKDFSLSREGMTEMKGITHQIALAHNYLFNDTQESIKTNIYYNHSTPKTVSYLDYNTQGEFIADNSNKNSSLVAMVDYLLPFTEYASFEVGMKSQTRKIDIQREDDFLGVAQTDNYSFDESILGMYMLINSSMERVKFQFGVRGESDLLNKNDNIRTWNLFPHLSFDYTSPRGSTLKMGYNSRISRPTVADMNPFMMLIDPTSQFQGDPNLKPEYSHNIYADYILKIKDSSVKFATYYRLVKNLITKNYTNTEDGMVLYRPINISRAHFYGANATTTLNFWNCLSVTPNVGIEIVELPSEYAQEINNVTTLNAGLNIGLQLQNSINIGALARYSSGSFSVGSGSQSAIVQGLAIGLPMLYSELSVSKGFFNNKLNLSVRITDPFNVQLNGFMVYSDNTQRESRYLMQTRFVHFGLSYRMNNHKASKRKYDDGGIKLF